MNRHAVLSRFSITQQVGFLAGLFLVGFAVFVAIAAYTISRTSVNGPIYGQIIQGKDLVADILPPPEYIIESYLVVFQALEEDPAKIKEHIAAFARLRKEFEERQDHWTKVLASGEVKTLLTGEAATSARDFFAAAEKNFFPALQRGDVNEAHRLLREVLTNHYIHHRTAINRIVTLTNARNELIEKETAALLSSGRWTMCAVVLMVTGISLFLAYLVIRSIYNTMTYCANITNRVAQGDLSVQIPLAGRGSIRTLLQSLGTMTTQLRTVVVQVSTTTSHLSAESDRLHSASQQIATGSDQISNEITGFAATTSELASTSHEIASNCKSVASSATQAMSIATTSTNVVQEAIDRMTVIAGKVRETSTIIDQLGERSEQIGQITETIEDIADQTNLLALNAAIEAARAGEMGRGFAVVADEVRALAERTTRATREITGMIANIQKDTRRAVACMEEGVREVEFGSSASLRSGEALNTIKDEVSEVTQQIEQIATAAEQQTATTTEIDSHVHQIGDAVRCTSQEAHSVAQSATQLTSLTKQLRELVGHFSV